MMMKGQLAFLIVGISGFCVDDKRLLAHVAPCCRCSACGEPGHNRRACPHHAAPERPKTKAQVCSVCKEPGHNARTCPSRPVKEQLNLPNEATSAKPSALRSPSASGKAQENSSTALQRRQKPIAGSQAAQGTQGETRPLLAAGVIGG